MIGLYSTWFIRIGDGPLWKYRISLEQERCQQSWWKNILYINNYYGNDKLCMFQSWYLAGEFEISLFWLLANLISYYSWHTTVYSRAPAHLSAVEVEENRSLHSLARRLRVSRRSVLHHILAETRSNIHRLAEVSWFINATLSIDIDPLNRFCSEVADLSTNDYFINTYGKTHMRSSAYIFGILAGFLAFYIHKKQ